MKKRNANKSIGMALLLVLLVLILCACAPKAASSNENKEKDSTPEQSTTIAWSMDSDCAVCHLDEGATMEDAKCLVGQHANQASATCISCHSDESALQGVHENAPAGAAKVKRLKKTAIEDSTCLSCHGSLEELATKTAESKILVDLNGTTVNPHAMPDTPGHAEEGSCVSCHDGHESVPVEETASEYCFSCHHHEVFECGTCH